MSPISSQSLNGANSASRGAREGLKKGNSSEFNPQDYEQVKSSPSLEVWSHEGSNLYPKMAQSAKIGVLRATPKNFLRPNKSVSRVYKTQLSKIN